MSCLTFVACVVFFFRRMHAKKVFVAPAALGAVALVFLVVLARALIFTFQAVSGASAADKATILAASIGEFLHASSLEALFLGPLVIIGWFVDRALNRHAPAGP